MAFVEGDQPGIAFSISRRVGGAVIRNRLRRRLRALAAGALAAGRLRAGAWLVIAAPGAGETPFAQLAEWWDACVSALT